MNRKEREEMLLREVDGRRISDIQWELHGARGPVEEQWARMSYILDTGAIIEVTSEIMSGPGEKGSRTQYRSAEGQVTALDNDELCWLIGGNRRVVVSDYYQGDHIAVHFVPTNSDLKRIRRYLDRGIDSE